MSIITFLARISNLFSWGGSKYRPPEPVIVKNIMKDPYTEEYRRSPNQSGTIRPQFIVIHDSCGAHDGTKSWILQSKSQVSYHYLIDSDGSRTQFVYDTKKAWHVGKSSWKGYTALNSRSVGVAFWGDSHKRHVSDTEIDSCAHKCIYLMNKFSLKKDAIVTHQMVSPNRKTDTSEETYQRVLKRVDELT